MIDLIREWLIGMITAALCLSLLEAIVPNGAMKGIAKISGGLVMTLVLLRPWAVLDLPEACRKYEAYQQEMDAQVNIYRKDFLQQMESIIQQETGAYISKKAAQMGIDCSAEVETQVYNDMPVPSSVTLNVPRNTALETWIAEELGISADKQCWEEGQ